MMMGGKLWSGLAVAAGLTVASPALAQADSCSSNGGYPEGSPGAVMAGIRGLSSGAYATCVERRRQSQPARNYDNAGQRAAGRRAAGRRAVELQLTDPSSAVFRSVRLRVNAEDVVTYCGEVSARNRAGIRSAFVRFEASVPSRGEPSARLDVEDGLMGQYFETAWRNYCGPGGTTVTF